MYTVPSAPDIVDVLPRYSTDTTLLKVTVQFSESVSPYVVDIIELYFVALRSYRLLLTSLME